ncbi:hypothetical protein ZWY2020_054707 [Hordeum vulgare]|nr:hypothetical protein ZWY2020_054707 [Hordeum vulgare]
MASPASLLRRLAPRPSQAPPRAPPRLCAQAPRCHGPARLFSSADARALPVSRPATSSLASPLVLPEPLRLTVAAVLPSPSALPCSLAASHAAFRPRTSSSAARRRPGLLAASSCRARPRPRSPPCSRPWPTSSFPWSRAAPTRGAPPRPPPPVCAPAVAVAVPLAVPLPASLCHCCPVLLCLPAVLAADC